MTSIPRVAIVGAAAAALLATVSACAEPGEPPASSAITIAVPAISENYDPFNGAHLFNSFNVQAVYDPLFVKDPLTVTYQPRLATEWTVSEDRHSIRMTLRDDVDFADGTHMDAEAVETYFDDLLASEGFVWRIRIVDTYGTEFTAVGEYELEITTTATIDYRLFDQLSHTPVASPAAIDDLGSLAMNPIGSGPYRIDEFTPGISISLVRNENYWDQDAFPFDTVTLKTFSDSVAALNALKSGQIDATLLDIPLAAEAEAEGFAIHEGKGQYRTLVILDRAGKIQPALADVRVRQAMNMAFDRETIAETVDVGYGSADSQVFTPGQAEYLDGVDDPYPFDPEKARELLAEAGYPDGFVLPIATTPNTDDIEPLVEQALTDIGITVEWQNFTWEQWGEDFLPRLQKGEFPVLLFRDFFVNTTTNYLKPTGVLAGWPIDPTMSELIDTISSGSDEESAAASQELGRVINDESFVVVISRPAIMWVSIPEVTVDPGQISGQPLIRDMAFAE